MTRTQLSHSTRFPYDEDSGALQAELHLQLSTNLVVLGCQEPLVAVRLQRAPASRHFDVGVLEADSSSSSSSSSK